MIGLLALCALAAAYGRMVRTHLIVHILFLTVAAAAFSMFTADQTPDTAGIAVFLFNLGFFGAFFAAGHLAGRWLDRDKYLGGEE